MSPLLIATFLSVTEPSQPLMQALSDTALYATAASAMEVGSVFAAIGEGLSHSAGATTLETECRLLREMWSTTSLHLFARLFRPLDPTSPSLASWQRNKARLQEIAATSEEDSELLHFLERHWLAKATGFYATMVDWICPSFGISVQVNPETTNSYARDPWNNTSESYAQRVAAWKSLLPHPEAYPLLLTRPANICDFLPSCLSVSSHESLQETVERIGAKLGASNSKVIIDMSELLPSWKSYRDDFVLTCAEKGLPLDKLICIERVQEESFHGIRILPLGIADESMESDHQYLLHRISKLGLSMNRVELDRLPRLLRPPSRAGENRFSPATFYTSAEMLSFLERTEMAWHSEHPQKSFMFQATVDLLKGFLRAISPERWEAVMSGVAKSEIAQLSFARMKEEFALLNAECEKSSFFEAVQRLEEIHAHLSTLLEIFDPFSPRDFPAIFKKRLTSLPKSLHDHISLTLHSSGMTSLAGIFKAVEKTCGRTPRILYGENTYFECIHTAETISNAIAMEAATEEDWREADLFLAQFNPVLRRIDYKVTSYRKERVSDFLRHALALRTNKPLTVALDCTLDLVDSPEVAQLFEEFQKEILRGELNLICYRSGLKFDLLGMDNYCGAPLLMLHNKEARWAPFDELLTDPALVTDRLSANWFCLAYQEIGTALNRYQKEIFANTRALLDRLPERLLSNQTDYRVIPVDAGADASFIDIKVFGPMHEMKAGIFVGGFLTVSCMDATLPLFYRPSFGFYHPNISILFGKECSTIRLTVGLDASQIDFLAKCFEKIDALNGNPGQTLLAKQ